MGGTVGRGEVGVGLGPAGRVAGVGVPRGVTGTGVTVPGTPGTVVVGSTGMGGVGLGPTVGVSPPLSVTVST